MTASSRWCAASMLLAAFGCGTAPVSKETHHHTLRAAHLDLLTDLGHRPFRDHDGAFGGGMQMIYEVEATPVAGGLEATVYVWSHFGFGMR